MAINTMDLIARMRMDRTDFHRGASEVQATATRLDNRLQTTFSRSGQGAGVAAGGMGKLTAAFAGAGVAAGAVIGVASQVGEALGSMAASAVLSAARVEYAIASIASIKPGIDTSLLTEQLADMSQRIPQSTAALSDGLYNIFSSLDIEQRDAVSLLEKLSKGAVAAQTDTQTFGTAVIGVMNAYGLAVEDADRVSNIFFNTVNAGVVNGQELASNLGVVTASAKQAGVSFDEMGALIVGVTKAGGPAAQNINNLANLLNKITTTEAQKDLQDLGIETLNADGSFRSLVELLPEVKVRLDSMSESARAAAINEIFPDVQARQGFNTLLGQIETVNKALETNRSGVDSTGRAYAIMADTATTRLTLMKNSLDETNRAAGEKLLPSTEKLTVAITNMAGPLTDLATTTLPLVTDWLERTARSWGVWSDDVEKTNEDVGTNTGRVYANVAEAHAAMMARMEADQDATFNRMQAKWAALNRDISDAHDRDAGRDESLGEVGTRGRQDDIDDAAGDAASKEQRRIHAQDTAVKQAQERARLKAEAAKKIADDAKKNTISAIQAQIDQTQSVSAALRSGIAAIVDLGKFEVPKGIEARLEAFAITEGKIMARLQKIALGFKPEALTQIGDFADSANSVGQMMQSTLGAFRDLETMEVPTQSILDRFFDGLTKVVVSFRARSAVWRTAMDAETAGMAEGVRSVTGGLEGAVGLLSGIAEQRTPLEGNINLFFDNLRRVVRQFAAASVRWKTQVTPETVTVATNVKTVMDSLNSAIDPLTKMEAASLVSVDQIGDVFQNVSNLMERMTGLAKGANPEQLKGVQAYMQRLGSIFGGLRQVTDGLTSLSDAQNSLGSIDLGSVFEEIGKSMGGGGLGSMQPVMAGGGSMGSIGQQNNYYINGLSVTRAELNRILDDGVDQRMRNGGDRVDR